MKNLKDYPDVGQTIYGRQKSKKAPDTRYLHMTVLQFIASGLVVLHIDESTSKAVFTLGMYDTVHPMYVNESVWEGIQLVN